MNEKNTTQGTAAGGSALGQAPGGSAPGQAAGISAPGQAARDPATGQAAGGSATGPSPRPAPAPAPAPAPEVVRLREALDGAEAVVVGAGAGLSTSAGFVYTGERFERLFGDFIAKYGFTDMYSGGFHPFRTPEEHWAYWSRYIWCNRYEPAPKDTYAKLLRLLEGRDFFVLTTNVDHQFQLAGFPKDRLFYTQGDYGLWQCSLPCHRRTYDNFETVKAMMERQRDMRVPSELVPACPRCGRPMAMNLRSDDTFVEDAGWHEAAERYRGFIESHSRGRVLYLELGVGGNTPGIIKYPFWRLADANPQAAYACVNLGQAWAPREIADRSVVVDADIDAVLRDLLRLGAPGEAAAGKEGGADGAGT